MTWPEYYIRHCFFIGLKSIVGSFLIWKDLLTSNYSKYALFEDQDPYEECLSWFWFSLGDDSVLTKELLDEIYLMIDEINSSQEDDNGNV